MSSTSQKSKVVAALLCFFLGGFGIHRFYTGHTVLGIIYLFTGGIFLIGVIVDFVMILTGSYKDKSGQPLV